MIIEPTKEKYGAAFLARLIDFCEWCRDNGFKKSGEAAEWVFSDKKERRDDEKGN